MFYRKGEIATLLTVVAVVLMTAGIFAGTKLSQKNTLSTTKAQANCTLDNVFNNPSLNQSTKNCQVQINFTPSASAPSPRNLTCALINPTKPAGSQLIASTKNMPSTYDFFSGTNIGQFPLELVNSQNLNLTGSQNYRLVVYDFSNPSCVLENNNMPASTINSLFGNVVPTSPQVQPTTPQAQPTTPQRATNTPIPTTFISDCEKQNVGGRCDSPCFAGSVAYPNDYGCKKQYGNSYSCCHSVSATSTPIPTATPIPRPQCEEARIGDCRNECNGEGVSVGDYGCSVYGSGYMCCANRRTTPVPTWTPKPTQEIIIIPTSRPTPRPTEVTQHPPIDVQTCSDIKFDHLDYQYNYIYFYYKNQLYALPVPDLADNTFKIKIINLTCKVDLIHKIFLPILNQ